MVFEDYKKSSKNSFFYTFKKNIFFFENVL